MLKKKLCVIFIYDTTTSDYVCLQNSFKNVWECHHDFAVISEKLLVQEPTNNNQRKQKELLVMVTLQYGWN